MVIDILDESLDRMNSVYDISNFRNKYIINDELIDSPIIETLNEHYEYILMNSNKIKLEEKYKYKPYSLSKFIYGTYDFWFLLMYMNGCFCFEEFNMPMVIIPREETLQLLFKHQKSNKPITIKGE